MKLGVVEIKLRKGIRKWKKRLRIIAARKLVSYFMPSIHEVHLDLSSSKATFWWCPPTNKHIVEELAAEAPKTLDLSVNSFRHLSSAAFRP